VGSEAHRFISNMTKYILHGGEIGKPSVNNQEYFQEMVKDLAAPIKVLLVYFAREKERWQEFMGYDKDKFEKAANDEKVECILASTNPEKLTDQINQSNIIYIIGGSDKALQKVFGQLSDLPDLFSGKVVAGSSAGANMLARYYYAVDRERVEKGLGVLPVKVLSHFEGEKYAGDDEERVKVLKDHKANLKIYTLPETRYSVIKSNR